MDKERIYIDLILDLICKEGKHFLQNYSQIEFFNEQSSKAQTSQEYKVSLIDFNGEIIINILMCIEEELLEFLLNQYFEEILEDEREELESALPDEIVNTIVGLAIKHFPTELEELILGVPYQLSLEQIQNIFLKDIAKTCKIVTNYGSMILTITQKNP